MSLYVGGLDDSVTLDLLRAAFLPFGAVKDIQLPLDPSGAHKGFGFVEFELPEDAEAAIDNMEGAELFGRTIRVNHARPAGGGGGGASAGSGRAVWAEAEGWYKNLKSQSKRRGQGEGEEGDEEEEGEGAGAASASGSGDASMGR